MRQLHTFILLLLIVLAGSAQSHMFQVKGGREPVPTPTPARAPRRPRPVKGAPIIRRVTPRFVYVTIVSNEPGCIVAVNDEPEEKATDGQGRLVIPMEPGTYDVRVTKPGYVTDGRPINVMASPTHGQEAKFTVTRALVSLKVTTNPAFMKVSLDGAPESESDANGLVTFTQVDPSAQHTLRGTKENFVGEPVTVLPYQKEATVTLKRDLLTLKVKTYPPRADVYLDDELKGTSNAAGELLIPKVKTGKAHSLRAEKDSLKHSETVPPDYELAVIKIPSTSAEARSAQGEPARRPETKAVEAASPPKDDAPRESEARQGDGATPAPQNAETPTPTPTPQPQRSVEAGSSVSPLDVELVYWNSIKDSKNPKEFAAYIKRYPQGQFVDLATIRMNDLLGKKEPEPEPAATPRAPETPTPTPTPAPTPSTTSAPVSTPEQSKQAQGQLIAANVQPTAFGEAKDAPALEETMEWLRRNFSAKFTYRYVAPREASGGVSLARDASIDFEPLRFEGCRLEWRVFDDVHRASLSDLDPLGVKVELRTSPGTTYSVAVWNLILTGAGGREAFEKVEAGRGGAARKYWRLVLLYDDKEKAGKLAAALRRAIELCGGKARP